MKKRVALVWTLSLTGPLEAQADVSTTDNLPWAQETASPRREFGGTGRPETRQLLRSCGANDQALETVAGLLLRRNREASPRTVDAGDLLPVVGEPHVWHRVWRMTGGDVAEKARSLGEWVASWPSLGPLRCGVAMTEDEQESVVVAVEALADLDPVPMRVPRQTLVPIRARLLVPVKGGQFKLQTPQGETVSLPTQVSERDARAQALLNERGLYKVQLVVDVPGGPRPALQARVYVEVEPQGFSTAQAASRVESLDAVVARVNQLRGQMGAKPLARNGSLDGVARAHVERVRKAREVVHDAGDGMPKERFEQAGIDARKGAENVALAPSLSQAQGALEDSVSHRAAMLRPEYNAVGVAMVEDPGGNVFLVQTFAELREDSTGKAGQKAP